MKYLELLLRADVRKYSSELLRGMLVRDIDACAFTYAQGITVLGTSGTTLSKTPPASLRKQLKRNLSM